MQTLKPATYNLSATTSLILHLDGDAFFVACEMTQFPGLHGKPVVVGEERGIAIALNYEAKALGITRGMPIYKIKRFFKEVYILPSHFELYEAYNQKMLAVLRRFALQVEEYSIDECFCLLGENQANEYGGWVPYVAMIKQILQEELGITFSFGLANTKVLAKVASKYQKPDGLTYIAPQQEIKYLQNIPIDKVWGIGYRTAPKLLERGIKTAFDFAKLPQSYIEQHFSAPFQELWHELGGTRIYDVHGDLDELPKSLQATRTFTPASGDSSRVYGELSKNIETACTRLRRFHLATSRVSVYVKTSEFRYRSVEIELPNPTVDPSTILGEVDKIFTSLLRKNERYRATGITLFSLVPEREVQQDLFGRHELQRDKSLLLHSIDELRKRYSTNVIFLII
jgi:DNA polymerase-4/DNA polymerase V